MNLKFTDKWVLLTGATKGIGRATAVKFAESGANLILVSRSENDLAELRHQIRGKGQIEIFQADLSESVGRESLVQFCKQKLPKLDVLVNNVGANIRKQTLDFSEEEVLKLYQTNCLSAWKLCTGLHELLRRGGGGAVVNISSVASFRFVGTSTAAYTMSKAAMNEMTSFFATEWGREGIRVNAVSPWYIKTPLVEAVLADRENERKILNHTPLQRIGDPDEVAATILFLASDKASYITGVNMPVDGGFSNLGMNK